MFLCASILISSAILVSSAPFDFEASSNNEYSGLTKTAHRSKKIISSDKVEIIRPYIEHNINQSVEYKPDSYSEGNETVTSENINTEDEISHVDVRISIYRNNNKIKTVLTSPITYRKKIEPKHLNNCKTKNNLKRRVKIIKRLLNETGIEKNSIFWLTGGPDGSCKPFLPQIETDVKNITPEQEKNIDVYKFNKINSKDKKSISDQSLRINGKNNTSLHNANTDFQSKNRNTTDMSLLPRKKYSSSYLATNNSKMINRMFDEYVNLNTSDVSTSKSVHSTVELFVTPESDLPKTTNRNSTEMFPTETVYVESMLSRKQIENDKSLLQNESNLKINDKEQVINEHSTTFSLSTLNIEPSDENKSIIRMSSMFPENKTIEGVKVKINETESRSYENYNNFKNITIKEIKLKFYEAETDKPIISDYYDNNKKTLETVQTNQEVINEENSIFDDEKTTEITVEEFDEPVTDKATTDFYSGLHYLKNYKETTVKTNQEVIDEGNLSFDDETTTEITAEFDESETDKTTTEIYSGLDHFEKYKETTDKTNLEINNKINRITKVPFGLLESPKTITQTVVDTTMKTDVMDYNRFTNTASTTAAYPRVNLHEQNKKKYNVSDLVLNLGATINQKPIVSKTNMTSSSNFEQNLLLPGYFEKFKLTDLGRVSVFHKLKKVQVDSMYSNIENNGHQDIPGTEHLNMNDATNDSREIGTSLPSDDGKQVTYLSSYSKVVKIHDGSALSLENTVRSNARKDSAKKSDKIELFINNDDSTIPLSEKDIPENNINTAYVVSNAKKTISNILYTNKNNGILTTTTSTIDETTFLENKDSIITTEYTDFLSISPDSEQSNIEIDSDFTEEKYIPVQVIYE